VPPAESAAELPFTPASALGLGATTGFNIMVWAVGPGRWKLAAATLTGDGGTRVALRTSDLTDPKLGSYLGPGAAFLIPVAPLAPQTRYTASVVFTDTAGKRLSRTWRFTTAAAAGDLT